MLLRTLTVLCALVFLWALPGVAQADTCPPAGPGAPPAGTTPTPPTPGGTTPTPTPPSPAPPTPTPTPSPTPSPPVTPTPPCDCAALCESRRTFGIRLVEKGGPITRATVQTLVGSYASKAVRATRRGGRWRGQVSTAGRTVRKGEFFLAKIVYRRRGESRDRTAYRVYQSCGRKGPPVNEPIQV